MKKYFMLIGMCLTVFSCVVRQDCTLSGLCAEDFRAEVDGKPTSFYTLTNSNGMEVCVTDYGARILSIMVPDRCGRMSNVIVGFDNISDYLATPVSHGAVIGRFANRIGNASFVLDGQRYELDRNSGDNCLHGGTKGWRMKVFSAYQPDSSTLVLSIDSPDGEMGFPGNVHAEVTYRVTEDNALDISYTAVTDKPTVLNMTSHSFFNLSGKRDHEIWDHILYVDADRFTPTNDEKVPTGEILPVSEAGIDYTVPRTIDGPFGINMVLNHPGDTTVVAASLYAPETGIRMDVYTDQPGIVTYVRNNTVCLETQHFPDSPNHPHFPSSVLRPGETYRHRCIYRFSTGSLLDREHTFVTYTELPLGSITPEGWLREKLELQRDNISKDLDETYPQVMGPSNGWLGGDGDQWERGPYWIDGLLPLAYILNDESLKEKVKPWVEWALASQREDGNFGPRTDYEKVKGIQRTNSLDWWPRMVVLKILQQHYNATGDERVLPFMTRYFHYQLDALDEKPLDHWTFWARYRHADQMNVALWLYRRTGDEKLLQLADKLHTQGFDFVKYFNEEGISVPGSIHCVNLAQGLKEPVIYWSATGDQHLLDATDKFFRDMPRFISYPTGMFGGDECLRDNDPTRGSELCSAVEFMYSLEEMMKITGNPFYAEYLERITFNALPTQMSKDFRLHQYFQQTNQIGITYGEHNFSTMKQGTGNLMGFLTGYPCCLSNLHQGYPKFTQNLWLRSSGDGLAALVYSPCRVSTQVKGVQVELNEITDYPKSDVIRIEVDPSQPVSFPMSLRIPSWSETPSVKVNGQPQEDVTPGEILVVDREWKAGDAVELHFPMKIEVTRWFENSAAIERGPLVYALDVEGKWEMTVNQKGDRKGQEYWEVKPVSPWNYSLIYTDVIAPEESFRYNDDGSISARGARIPHWVEINGDAAPIPYTPIRHYGTWPSYGHEHGPVEVIRLIPYGETTLRIAQFPVIIRNYEGNKLLNVDE